MAHQLNFANGKYAYYGVRELPWHKLGQTVDAPGSNKEARKLAGLDWDVIEMPLYRKDMETITSHKAIVRSDNQKSLGVVTKHYTPVQNSELFQWLEGLDGYADLTIETAGALGAGETVWVLGRCNAMTFDIGGDEQRGYMLLANGHAGNRRLQIMPTVIRVCCANTLAMASGGMEIREDKGKEFTGNLSQGFALRHTKSIHDMMLSIQTAYAKTTEAWKNTEQVMRHLASKPLTEEAISTLFSQPFDKPKRINEDQTNLMSFVNDDETTGEDELDEGIRAAALKAAREKKLREILNSEECNRYEATKGTLFAGFNAVTSYLDHEATRQDDAGRFASANFGGERERTKRRAYKVALELAKA